MNVFRQSHVMLIKAAIGADPKIVSSREQPEPQEQFYLEELGLTEALLKRMERYGLACRAYRNETRSDGHPGGLKKYWVIYFPKEFSEQS